MSEREWSQRIKPSHQKEKADELINLGGDASLIG